MNVFRKIGFSVILLTFITSCNSTKNLNKTMENPTTLEQVKKYALGEWQSLSVELRPTEDRTGSEKLNQHI